MNVVPKIGKAVARDEESYRYLVESIRRFPPMERFRAMIEKARFTQTKVEPILGGLVAIHSGWKV
jgi:demethylmenaquinone methyltransferase/2-methoxy-6-polyprenyl-1,4-benzoquinol methylase